MKEGDLVYALHSFEPEQVDELAMYQGEEILVLSDDSEFGDGWFEVSDALRTEEGRGAQR